MSSSPVRSVLARVRDAARRRTGPLVTVVVTAGATQSPFLDEALGSVRSQTHARLEVLVVPVGAPSPTVLETVRRHEAEDRRVRLLAACATLADARNHGAAGAAGELVYVVQGAHTLPPEAIGTLLAVQQRTGSDVVVGRVARPGAGPDEAWLADLRHGADAGGSTVLAASWAVAGARVEGVLFRSGAWTPVADGVGTDPQVVRAVVAAHGVQVVRDTTYTAHDRGTGRAFGHMASHLADLPGWTEGVEATRTELEGRGTDLVDPWLTGLLLHDLPLFLDDVERMDSSTWQQLVATWTALLDGREQAVLDELPVHVRLSAWLLRNGDQGRVVDAVVSRWFDKGPTTRVQDGEVFAEPAGSGPDVPADLLRLSERETPLVVSLRRVRSVDDALELDLFAFVRQVDLHDVTPETDVWLVHGDGHRVRAEVRPYVDPVANRYAAQPEQDVSTSGVTASVRAELLAPGDWRVEVVTVARGVRRTGTITNRDRQGSAGVLGVQRIGDLEVVPRADGGGTSFLVRPSAGTTADRQPDGFVVERVEDTAEALVLTGRWVGEPRAVALRVAELSVPGVVDDGRVTFPLNAARWGGPVAPLPSGVGQLDAPVRPSSSLLGSLPIETSGAHHRLRWTCTSKNRLSLTLAAPLRDDEIGAFAQQRLRTSYRSETRPVDPRWVYLQSYTGESATDSPRAIHEELVRRHPDLVLHWGVADLSVPVPPGGVPVVIRSREWYDVLARSGSLVSNINFDRWFRKRPGQRVLQTFHGYPSKAMGQGLWATKEFPPRRVEIELARSRADWDVILTPVPEMDVHYRREYAFDGTILSVGYPRDDALVAPDRDEVRERTRRLLGIRDGQTAVLYAPTWRDDLATNFRKARASDALDLERAVAALGDEVVWLLRGHRFHSPPDRATSDRTVDVGGYPEINDLVLAADVAVLDYSSLRFDFALTGKPMVFLVPDLDSYAGGTRGFLFDFAGSAPGPLVASTDAVVDAVRVVAAGQNPWAERIAAFNTTFNHTQDGHATERVVDAFFGQG